jgi:thymidine kinase
MRYGELTVYTGPMFAEKTNTLVKEILFRTYFNSPDKTVVYKPFFDNRYARDHVISHDGLKVQANIISSVDQIDAEGARWAFFDEVQFFTAPNFSGDLVETIRKLRRSGVDVYCAGLDMDYMGRAFEVTALLMAEAERVEKLKADCGICGSPATHTSRVHIDRPDRFELGSQETYSPMCAVHWAADLETRLPEADR